MPYKTEKEKLGEKPLKKSVKLLDCQRERLRQMREQDGLSYNALAKIFHCSKRLAFFICNPDKEKKAKEQYKERRKDKRYYKKEKHTAAIKKHRKRKNEILKGL